VLLPARADRADGVRVATSAGPVIDPLAWQRAALATLRNGPHVRTSFSAISHEQGLAAVAGRQNWDGALARSGIVERLEKRARVFLVDGHSEVASMALS